MKKIQKGFTLIELMIVVAIIGILAAVAIPAYQDYIVKAKLSKGVGTVEPIKLALAMYYQEQGSFIAQTDPWTSLGMSGGPTTITEVPTVAVTACTTTPCDGSSLAKGNSIVITLAAIKAGTIDGNTVTMTPTPGTTAMVWNNTCQVAGTATSVDPIMKKYFKCP